MAVRFTQDYTTKEENPQTFHKDQVVDFYEYYQDAPPEMPPEQAESNRRTRAAASEKHFINRGVAVQVQRQDFRTGPQSRQQLNRQESQQEQPKQPEQPEQPQAQPQAQRQELHQAEQQAQQRKK